MRQRLLLVAGWLLAAIGAGVVASAAVAVAGGQVMDRPLSPLTAAEVAALPVVGTERTQEQIERLASGASGPTDRAPADERERATATGSTGFDSPAGDGGASASDGAADNGESDGENRIDTADPEAFSAASSDVESVKESRIIGSDVATIHVPGGSARVADLGDHLSLLWATPRPQYVVGLRFDSPTNLTLTFTSTLRRHVIDVELGEEGILVTNDLVATEDDERDGREPLGS
jgi:hypothetical protein